MKIICIDAGHGGIDAGAVNGKAYEKNAALGMALRLGQKLEARGFKVIYTRTTDIFPSLQNRCNVANKNKVNYFISIHCNSAANKDATGIETWYYRGSSTGKKLATSIQDKLKTISNVKDRGIKEGTFYVLKYTNAPAVLVEAGFISNDNECARLFTESYQDAVAQKVADGLVAALR